MKRFRLFRFLCRFSSECRGGFEYVFRPQFITDGYFGDSGHNKGSNIIEAETVGQAKEIVKQLIRASYSDAYADGMGYSFHLAEINEGEELCAPDDIEPPFHKVFE